MGRTCRTRGRDETIFQSVNFKGRDHLGETHARGTKLNWFSRGSNVWLLCSIKGGKFLQRYHLFHVGPVPWS